MNTLSQRREGQTNILNELGRQVFMQPATKCVGEFDKEFFLLRNSLEY